MRKTILSFGVITTLIPQLSLATDKIGGRDPGILKITLSEKCHIEIYYDLEHVTLSSNYLLNEIHITILNLGTGEEQEFTIDTLTNEINLPVHLSEGSYSITVENPEIHYATIIVLE